MQVCSLKCELEEKEKERISLKRKCDMQCKQLSARIRQLQIEATHKVERMVFIASSVKSLNFCRGLGAYGSSHGVLKELRTFIQNILVKD
jgi:hypothetical protein